MVARWIRDVAADDAAAAAAESDVVGWIVFKNAPVVLKIERAWDCVPLEDLNDQYLDWGLQDCEGMRLTCRIPVHAHARLASS